MKHNVLTTLLVGLLLTVVGVNRSWAVYQEVNGQAEIRSTSPATEMDLNFTNCHTKNYNNVTCIWSDTETAVNGSTRALGIGESATMIYKNALKDSYSSCDVYVKVTTNVAIDNTTTWAAGIFEPSQSEEHQRYIYFRTRNSGVNDCDYEVWLQNGNTILDDTKYIVVNCSIQTDEYVKFYGVRNVLYTNNMGDDGGTIVWNIAYADGYWKGARDDNNNPNRVYSGIGFTDDHHVKFSYKSENAARTTDFKIMTVQTRYHFYRAGDTRSDFHFINNLVTFPSQFKSYKNDGWQTDEDLLLANGTIIPKDGFIAGSALDSIVATRQTYLIYCWPCTLRYSNATLSPSYKMIKPGLPYGTLPTPNKSGEIFLGWYTASSGGKLVTQDTLVNTKYDHYIYAHWTKGAVVTFSVNGGGSVSPTTKSVPYNTLYGELPTPTRDRYEFIGWFTAASGGTEVTATTNMTNENHHNLYAHWKQYTNVKFNAGSGTVSPDSLRKYVNQVYGTLPKPVLEDSVFIGWFTEQEGGTRIDSATIVTNTADHILYAHWTPEVAVTLNPNGGSVSPADIVVGCDLIYGKLPKPTKSRSLFLGWFTDEEEGTLVDSATTVTNCETHSLYAHWDLACTVTYEAHGGSCSVSPTQKVINQPYGELPETSRPGYTFNGWFSQETGGDTIKSTTLVTNTEDHSIHAQWTVNKYEVTFVNDSGTIVPDTVRVVTYDAPYGEMPEVTHKGAPTDFIYHGWNTAEDGSGRAITADSLVKTAQNHYLYAQWEQKPDTVTLNLNYPVADPVFDTFIGKWGDTYKDSRLDNYSTSPARDSFSCIGWFTDPQEGVKVSSTDSVARQNKLTLYAHWELKRVTVTFNPRYGQCDTESKEVIYTHIYGALPKPTMVNYTFQGWSNEVSYGQPVDSSTKVTKQTDHYLHAQWSGRTIVTFNPNKGTVNVDTMGAVIGKAYPTFPTPTRTGYFFDGWWTDSVNGSPVVLYQVVTNPEHHTLYAHWHPLTTYTHFMPNGGHYIHVLKYGRNVVYDMPYGNPYGSTPAPNWPNETWLENPPYRFAGWFTEPVGGTEVLPTTINKQTTTDTIYAHWDISYVTDGTGMEYTDARQAVNDSLSMWKELSKGQGNTVNVVIYRKIYKKNFYNTICLPFNVSKAKIKQTFGEDPKELKIFESATVEGEGDDRELILQLRDTDAIKAGVPYLISFNEGQDLDELLFQGVKVTMTAMDSVSATETTQFQGIFAPWIMTYEDQNLLFLGQNNRLYWPKADGTFTKGFRAYFKVAPSVGNVPIKRGMKARFGEGKTVATGITNTNTNTDEIKKLIEDGRVVIKTNGVKYDMNGKKL